MKEKIKVLEVVAETEILGRIIKMYGNIDFPWFMASDVAKWIDYSKGSNGKYQISNMVKKVDENEKGLKSFMTLGGIQKTWALTEDGLYECCMRSTKPIAKKMKKEIKTYLKSIRLTGAAIPQGKEEDMVKYYFNGLSQELQGNIVAELVKKNDELQQFYDDLMNTEGLMSMNLVSKELNGFGLKRLYSYLRKKKIVFYKDGINIPYQRFVDQGLFSVKETICQDGITRSVTYVTKKGLDYIRKLLRNDGSYNGLIE